MRAKFIVTVWLLFGAASVYGFLERTPDSYLLISKDQTRCLAMSWPAQSRRWTNDAGRLATLPDGRTIDLYTQFPSNGVYRLPDLVPVYFLNRTYESNRLAFSPDFGAIALVNEYALDNSLADASRSAPKAIRFFNKGQEVRA